MIMRATPWRALAILAASAAALLPIAAAARAASAFSAEPPPAAARRRAFASPSAGRNAALLVQCGREYDAVAVACGRAAAGHHVPSQCSAWCQLVYLKWWPMCQHVREYATIEAATGGALSGFFRTCQAAARPTCSPCPGSAQASDVLSLDKLVLSAGTPKAAAFRTAWRGQIASMLCVGAGQIAVTAIARASGGGGGGGGGGHRRLSEASVEVTWTVAAGSNAIAQSLVHAGQRVMGRQLSHHKGPAAPPCHPTYLNPSLCVASTSYPANSFNCKNSVDGNINTHFAVARTGRLAMTLSAPMTCTVSTLNQVLRASV